MLRSHSWRRSIFTASLPKSHENPLGLPSNNTRIPPQVPRRGPITGGLPSKRRIPNVKHVVLVSSCKGGVGKSTFATNLAVSLSLLPQRLRVGILDLDIFGPSIPTLMGLKGVEEPDLTPDGALIPITNHGIPTMSMSYLLPPSPSTPRTDSEPPTNEDTPVVWRGLMVQKAVQQLLFQTDWSAGVSQGASSGLDVLVVDLPPGTGDIPLSVGQLVDVDSTIIITTPDILSLSDVRRGVAMFRKLDIPLTGLVINNAYFICPNCTERHYLFGANPNDEENMFAKDVQAMRMGVVGELPLVMNVSRGGENGVPYALSARCSAKDTEPGNVWQAAMKNIAVRIWGEIRHKANN
ncbi:P-loop containing nucleoside triphosphate hydrolase protein [Lentinula aciculospora]|uniref:P-loop containing nucleoside triphosphate hydrolase protein n=1 Tax=Lentinula aciculospora TaxID=153920 RepID=A0A9W9AW36_9AGAR|nr:P-loop containing nucleoside triphosphate hydrolase protein [Lentinula aciculospora]